MKLFGKKPPPPPPGPQRVQETWETCGQCNGEKTTMEYENVGVKKVPTRCTKCNGKGEVRV